MIRYIKGDLVEMMKRGEVRHAIHGCNCFTTMGSGIAAQIAKAFPGVREVDKKTAYGEPTKLGTYTKYYDDKLDLLIWNGYTQYDFGTDGRKLEYCAVDKLFQALYAEYQNRHLFFDSDNRTVHIPKIGAGLAGGDWSLIEKIIDGWTQDIEIVVVEYVRG